jgi:hypothetical protein
MKRDELLNAAKDLVNRSRAAAYGEAYENHENIAKLWSVILKKEISVAQVYQCMILLKVARLINTPEHEDSWVDIAGYASLGGEIDGTERE